jgi:Transglycosylase
MRTPISRWWPVAAVGAGVIVLSAAVVLVLPGAVGRRAVAEAASRGVTMTVEGVDLGLFVVTLEGVNVQLEGVDALSVHFGDIRADVSLGLHPTSIVAERGQATVRDVRELPKQVADWRSRRPAASSPTRASPVRVSIEVTDLATIDGPAERVAGSGVLILRDADRTLVSAKTLEAALGSLVIKGKDGSVTFDRASSTPSAVHLAAAELVWVLAPRTENDGAAAATAAVDVPPPPPEPPAARNGSRAKPSPKEPAPPLPRLLPDLHALRAEIDALGAAAASKIPEGSKLGVDALSVRLQKGAEDLALGTGRLDLDRDTSRIELTFSTTAAAHATPIAVQATLPTTPGDVEIGVSGGPVPLDLLGMRDGGLLHLLDVGRSSVTGKARVVLDAHGSALVFDVATSLRGLSVSDPRLARDPVRGMDLAVSARGLIDDKGELRLDDAETSVGSVRAHVHGGLSQTPDSLAAAFDFESPTSSCEALLTSIPSALVPTVSGARMDGTFGLRGHLAFDTRDLDAMSFEYEASDRCRLIDVPPQLDRERFSKSFTHVVYSKTGELEEQETGPGTPGWTSLEEISPYMQVAVLTTEDGAFFHHHGFNHAAIRHALAADLKARKFVRGASTITMQLAKNLFLSRDKTLARKLEELVLADYLEQAFTKEEMMELYLNIIEFGPDLYGVTAAADHYFGRKPSELNLAECLFLSSILPNPVGFHKVYGDKQLGDAWMRTIRARMDLAAKNGLVSPAELAEGLTEVVAFHHEGDPPPPPRAAVSTPTHPAGGSDWQELN